MINSRQFGKDKKYLRRITLSYNLRFFFSRLLEQINDEEKIGSDFKLEINGIPLLLLRSHHLLLSKYSILMEKLVNYRRWRCKLHYEWIMNLSIYRRRFAFFSVPQTDHMCVSEIIWKFLEEHRGGGIQFHTHTHTHTHQQNKFFAIRT